VPVVQLRKSARVARRVREHQFFVRQSIEWRIAHAPDYCAAAADQ
jgi:hypothetical protein